MPHLTQKQGSDMLFLARLFYFTMHVLSYMVLILYDNPMRRLFLNSEIFEPILFTSFVGCAIYLFLTAGQNPGFYIQSDTQKMEFQNNQGIELTIEDQKDFIAINIDRKEETLLEASSSTIPKIHKFHSDNKKLKPPREFCQDCNQFMNYRMRHCKICQRCTPKFDHHCFWVGGCIGELNHRKFYIYLIVQTYVHIQLFFYFWNALDLYTYIKSNEDGTITYSQEYGAFLTLSMIIGLLTLFTGGLLVYHTFLIIIGSTTWEHSKKHRISYLKIYPAYFNPFDQGIIQNIRAVFFHGNQIKRWELPDIPNKETSEPKFNYLRNKYYTCC